MPNVTIFVPKINLLFRDLPHVLKKEAAKRANISLRSLYRKMNNPKDIPYSELKEIKLVLERHFNQEFQIEELLKKIKI